MSKDSGALGKTGPRSNRKNDKIEKNKRRSSNQPNRGGKIARAVIAATLCIKRLRGPWGRTLESIHVKIGWHLIGKLTAANRAFSLSVVKVVSMEGVLYYEFKA